MKVCKFDGASVGSVKSMKDLVNLINDSTPKIIVLSATADIAKHLDDISACLFNRDIDQAHNKITKLEFQFVDFANQLLLDESIKQKAIDYILERFHDVWNFTKKTFTSADEKEIMAQGELISTNLMSLYLQEQQISNTPLCAFHYMRTGLDGEPDMEYMETRLTAFIKLHSNTQLFITQGSICKNAYGETDHLRHGGSDYTASLIGAAIRAEEIQLWTNLSGMRNSDPQVVEGTQTVKNLSFEEAERLAYFDDKTLPLYCITPARERNIPVRLLNTMNPSASGTLISDRQDDSIIKAVATKDAVMYLKFESNNTLRPYLFISKIFEIFAKYRTSLCLLTSSNIDVSVAVDNKDFLSSIIRELNRYAKVLVEDRMSIVSVIGNMKWQYPGFESRIIEALKTVPLRMISYGSNNNDISLVIKATDKKRALQSLNDQLFQSVQ